MDRISDLREAAPDWYEARKSELAGKGYPSLGDVPRETTYRSQRSELELTRAQQNEILAAFNADPRSQPAYLTAEEIQAWGAALRRKFDAEMTPANFLTDADIVRLKAKFDRPRARR